MAVNASTNPSPATKPRCRLTQAIISNGNHQRGARPVCWFCQRIDRYAAKKNRREHFSAWTCARGHERDRDDGNGRTQSGASTEQQADCAGAPCGANPRNQSVAANQVSRIEEESRSGGINPRLPLRGVGEDVGRKGVMMLRYPPPGG